MPMDDVQEVAILEILDTDTGLVALTAMPKDLHGLAIGDVELRRPGSHPRPS